MSEEEEAQTRSGARASGGLIGVGSATGGLVVGPETLLGKILIIASPVTSVSIDYAVIRGRATLERWEEDEPIRRLRRRLKRAIRDRHTPEDRKVLYRRQLADLHDAAIAREFARIAGRSSAVHAASAEGTNASYASYPIGGLPSRALVRALTPLGPNARANVRDEPSRTCDLEMRQQLPHVRWRRQPAAAVRAHRYTIHGIQAALGTILVRRRRAPNRPPRAPVRDQRGRGARSSGRAVDLARGAQPSRGWSIGRRPVAFSQWKPRSTPSDGSSSLSAPRRKFGRSQAASATVDSCSCSSMRLRRSARSSRVKFQSNGSAISL